MSVFFWNNLEDEQENGQDVIRSVYLKKRLPR